MAQHSPSEKAYVKWDIRAGDTVTVADMVMQRIVNPPRAGSNPVSHLCFYIGQALTQRPGCFHALLRQVHIRNKGIFSSCSAFWKCMLAGLLQGEGYGIPVQLLQNVEEDFQAFSLIFFMCT